MDGVCHLPTNLSSARQVVLQIQSRLSLDLELLLYGIMIGPEIWIVSFFSFSVFSLKFRNPTGLSGPNVHSLFESQF